MLGKLRKMRTLADDDDEITPAAGTSSSTQPAWMRSLMDKCKEWLGQLPPVSTTLKKKLMTTYPFTLKTFDTVAKQSVDNHDPLYRLFSREGSVGRRLLSQVRKDLSDVVLVCQGSLKQTNHLRSLLSSLTKGAIQFAFSHIVLTVMDRYNPDPLEAIQDQKGYFYIRVDSKSSASSRSVTRYCRA